MNSGDVEPSKSQNQTVGFRLQLLKIQKELRRFVFRRLGYSHIDRLIENNGEKKKKAPKELQELNKRIDKTENKSNEKNGNSKKEYLLSYISHKLTSRKIVIKRAPQPSKEELNFKYNKTPSASQIDNFVFYRILGNDLYPRHKKGQSLENARFILENEPAFPDCEKRWVVNRLIDFEEEASIIDLLESHDQPYLHIPFEKSEFKKTEWDFIGLPPIGIPFSNEYLKLSEYERLQIECHFRRLKNIYVMNNNGARNAALEDGRRRAKWILPFDGNCYFTPAGFEELRQRILFEPWYPYFVVPMARVTENEKLLNSDYRPQAEEEPQIIFRSDAKQAFDERMSYGRRPKVELLWRLDVPGPWDRYKFDPWELEKPSVNSEGFCWVGWVARMDSGHSDLETGGRLGRVLRSERRAEAIINTLDGLDAVVVRDALDPDRLAYYDRGKLETVPKDNSELNGQLLHHADLALGRGPFSVIDKTELPPSGDIHDYWHPAPFWWPNPSKKDGLPYVRRDGERVPGTELFDKLSDRYDRTRLQHLFNDTTVLALAGTANGEPKYLAHAADLVRAWFIDPQTRMNPHLRYSQVRRGHNSDVGNGMGIIEFKDLYFFLDAVRLVIEGGALSQSDVREFKEWLATYAEWLAADLAGQSELVTPNNHGTYYDLQCASIAIYLGRPDALALICNRTRGRLASQFAGDGAQTRELKRTRPMHYCLFTLSGWLNIARMTSMFGADLRRTPGATGPVMHRAFEWLADAHAEYISAHSRFEQVPIERMEPLWAECRKHFPEIDNVPQPTEAAKEPLFHPDFGIAPFWMLAKD